MIPCPVCGNVNPFTTRFCRKCGHRLEIKVSQVAHALDENAQTRRQQRFQGAGTSTLVMAVFALVCALFVRYVLVPALPPADLPPYQADSLLPLPPAPVHMQPAATRLEWRHQTIAAELDGLGVDLVHLEAQQHELIEVQRGDGSFSGDDSVAATGLAALALQAYPLSEEARAAAAAARTYLSRMLGDFDKQSTLARVLAVAALLDAETLTPAQWNQAQPAMSDGQEPAWQALTLASLPPERRPSSLALLAPALDDPVGKLLLLFLTDAPRPAQLGAGAPFSTQGTSPATGEGRMLWALTAWQVPASPELMISLLSAWSRNPPAPIDPGTLALCGPQAPSEVAILTICACGHVAPLWFASR